MAVPYQTRADWRFPDEDEGHVWEGDDTPPPNVFAKESPEGEAHAWDRPDRQPKVNDGEAEGAEGEEIPESSPKPQRRYKPRTCRICLEEVLPTFEPLTSSIPSILHPTPRVNFISSDPTSGRLIRPCKCSGTQKYVHEGCLQEWRYADPTYGLGGRSNYWECPTCKFKYSFERIRWSRIITSTLTQIAITTFIMVTLVFLFGFVADPIINLYLDPVDTITSMGGAVLEEEDDSWTLHFVKGLTSLGLLGFVKVFFAMSPWHWWNLRQTGIVGGGRRRGGTGRDRMEDISWTVVIIGVVTFLVAVWQFTRSWTARTLEKASDRVADVQGPDDDDFEDLEEPIPAAEAASKASGAAEPPEQAKFSDDSGFAERSESRKTK